MKNFFYDKKFINKQIYDMYQRGGLFQKAAEKVKSILYNISNNFHDPFQGVTTTNHGETRIENCVKYDLPGFTRLITVQNETSVVIVFLGNHDECDRWLDNNKGKKITYDPEKKVIVDVFETADISNTGSIRKVESDFAPKLLYEKLGGGYFHRISCLLNGTEIAPFYRIDSQVPDDDLLSYCQDISNPEYQSLFLDVFTSLVSGDVDSAKNRINYHFDQLIPLASVEAEKVNGILSNDVYIKSNDLDPEILEFIVNKANWHEFMLFLHPSQREIVQRDFSSVSRLLGVSGSGKTSVLVHRALRLAEIYPNEKILILTLNSALSKLLQNLVTELASFKKKTSLVERIVVSSYWTFCREKLLQFEHSEPLIQKKYESKGYKDGNIKQIWSEYYLYQQDEFIASDLFPIHQSLLSRGVNPSKYLKDEFDWVRSAFLKLNRENYLSTEREGRAVPFSLEYRKLILAGLEKWEQKMDFVGISDYMNLTTRLEPYLDRITPEFRCVLVDEIQDFGTTELQVIKRLAEEKPNNFFFTGDLAQQVYAKNHKIRNAGFNILPEGYVQLLKNYRNSREILDAAYHMFSTNVSVEQIESEDFKILNPEYANFSFTRPFLRNASSLMEEISMAIHYLQLFASDGKKSCIAICGLGYFAIDRLGSTLGLKVLDGKLNINDADIFLSDLEQTKGFEFDIMVILNATDGVFPNPSLPDEEIYRDICKLYVAMTRAKKELIVSYSGKLSKVFKDYNNYYTLDEWSIHLDETYQTLQIEIGDDLASKRKNIKLTGRDFILAFSHLKMSKSLQDKIIDTVTGKSLSSGRELNWKTVHDLFLDLEISKKTIPIRNSFGPTTFDELQELKRYFS